METKNIDTEVIEYVGLTQEQLEKYASKEKDFSAKLQSKLNSMVKAGALSSAEAHTILKEASDNPSNVLNYLDIPTYQHKIATLASEKSSAKMDPLEQFCRF